MDQVLLSDNGLISEPRYSIQLFQFAILRLIEAIALNEIPEILGKKKLQ